MFRLPAPSLRPLAILLALATYHGQAMAQPTPPERNSPKVIAAFKQVTQKPSESTVRVFAGNDQLALGTIVSADGYIVTKASELRPPVACKLKDGRTFTARIVGIEDNHDLALLKINASRLKPVEWRAAKTADVGQWVTAPNPNGEAVAIGVVSVGVRRPSEMELVSARRTQPRQNSGYLGVTLEENEDGSPLIVRVEDGSPAEKAGLLANDIVVSVSGRVVRTRDRLMSLIQTLQPGQEVSIKVNRKDEGLVSVKVKLARFPRDKFGRSERMNMMGSKLSHRLGGFPVILQHDLVIDPHDCGGPLVDLDGKALGVNIARAGRTESFALPAETVQALLPDLKSGALAPADDGDESRVAQLEVAYRKVQGELARMEGLAKTLSGENAEEAKRLAGNLRKKLQRTKDELDKARKEETRK